jgi:hypothetical protein
MGTKNNSKQLIDFERKNRWMAARAYRDMGLNFKHSDYNEDAPLTFTGDISQLIRQSKIRKSESEKEFSGIDAVIWVDPDFRTNVDEKYQQRKYNHPLEMLIEIFSVNYGKPKIEWGIKAKPKTHMFLDICVETGDWFLVDSLELNKTILGLVGSLDSIQAYLESLRPSKGLYVIKSSSNKTDCAYSLIVNRDLIKHCFVAQGNVRTGFVSRNEEKIVQHFLF